MKELKLRLHPQKAIIQKLKQGVDFLDMSVSPIAAPFEQKPKKEC